MPTGWYGRAFQGTFLSLLKVRELNIHHALLQSQFLAIKIAQAPSANFFAKLRIPTSRTLETTHVRDSESSLHQEKVPAIHLPFAYMY